MFLRLFVVCRKAFETVYMYECFVYFLWKYVCVSVSSRAQSLLVTYNRMEHAVYILQEVDKCMETGNGLGT